MCVCVRFKLNFLFSLSLPICENKTRSEQRQFLFFSFFTQSTCYTKSLLLLRLGVRGSGVGLVLRILDGDNIRQSGLGAVLAGGVLRQHDLHLQTKHALAEVDVADGDINELLHRV